MLGAVEAGGTKVHVAVGNSPYEIVASARIPTTEPKNTISAMLEFFDDYQDRLRGFGVASFGPVRLDRQASDWGELLNTPKPGWSGASFVQPLLERYRLTVALDTDVNAAALAEQRFGALRGTKSGVYITIGTGIGAGIVIEGRPVHGLLHPEFGHVRVRRNLPIDDGFAGACSFHGDCLEGLASGSAIERRWGCSLSELPCDHPAHALIADYLGQACATLALTLSTAKIVIGGGVSQTAGLHAAAGARMRVWLAGYLASAEIMADDYVTAPALHDRAGLIGGFLLAEGAARCSPAHAVAAERSSGADESIVGALQATARTLVHDA